MVRAWSGYGTVWSGRGQGTVGTVAAASASNNASSNWQHCTCVLGLGFAFVLGFVIGLGLGFGLSRVRGRVWVNGRSIGVVEVKDKTGLRLRTAVSHRGWGTWDYVRNPTPNPIPNP